MVPCWVIKRADIDEDSGIDDFLSSESWLASGGSGDGGASIFPNLCPLAAVGANIDILAALEDLAAEFHILFVVPHLFEGFAFEVAERVLRIFIEAAGHYQPIP